MTTPAHLAKVARLEEEARQKQISYGRKRVDSIFSQFDDNYFNAARKDYTNFYEPQLARQEQDANDKMQFHLARTGNINSSNAGTLMERLARTSADSHLAIAGQADDRARGLRGDIENQRSQLMNFASMNADAAATANMARQNAAALSQPQGFSPIGNMFGQFTAGLGQGIGQYRQNSYTPTDLNASKAGGAGSSRVVN